MPIKSTLCAIFSPGFGTAGTLPDNMQTVPMNPDQMEESALFAVESIGGVVDLVDDDDSGPAEPTQASRIQFSLLKPKDISIGNQSFGKISWIAIAKATN